MFQLCHKGPNVIANISRKFYSLRLQNAERMALAEPRHNKNLFSRIPTRCDTNRAVQEQKMDRGIELRIKEVQSL